ncbi:MAG: hypothetical protein GX231_03190 [Tissierellia bacterium]|nr:hypothetical protein [Tissierellia bacterium]
MSNLELVSWDANGIRTLLERNFMNDFNIFDGDIFAFRKLKVSGEVK